MPNICARCGKVHPDGAEYLLKKGCDACGGRFFFYVSEKRLVSAKEEIKRLSEEEIKEMENDVREMIKENRSKEEPVILDIEAISIEKPGKYLIDLTRLFNQRPIVIKVAPGKYRIDIGSISSEKIKNEK